MSRIERIARARLILAKSEDFREFRTSVLICEGEAHDLSPLCRACPGPAYARVDHPQGAEPEATRANLDRIGQQFAAVQIDTLHVVQRAHYLTLWSRFGNYDPAAFDALSYDPADRRWFEGWFHAACYLPLADYRYRLPGCARPASIRGRGWKNSSRKWGRISCPPCWIASARKGRCASRTSTGMARSAGAGPTGNRPRSRWSTSFSAAR